VPGSLLVLLLLLLMLFVLMYDVDVLPVWPARWLSHSLNANMAAFCWRLQHLLQVLSTKGFRLLQRLPISIQQGLRDTDGSMSTGFGDQGQTPCPRVVPCFGRQSLSAAKISFTLLQSSTSVAASAAFVTFEGDQSPARKHRNASSFLAQRMSMQVLTEISCCERLRIC
jgi:hypothetical protein